jgi:two-component sensor histidine kinase
VTWTADRSAEPAMLDIAWIENGGPRVAPPARSGFGTRLLQTGLPRELGGSVSMDYEPGGFRCRMKVAVSHKITLVH